MELFTDLTVTLTGDSTSFFNLQFNRIQNMEVVIPVSVIGTGYYGACDVYQDSFFVNTSTVRVGGLKYVTDYAWPLDNGNTTQKTVLIFNDHFNANINGMAKCVATLMNDGTEYLVGQTKKTMRVVDTLSEIKTGVKYTSNNIEISMEIMNPRENKIESIETAFDHVVFYKKPTLQTSNFSVIDVNSGNNRILETKTQTDYYFSHKLEPTPNFSGKLKIKYPYAIAHGAPGLTGKTPVTIIGYLRLPTSLTRTTPRFAFLKSVSFEYDLFPCPSGTTCLPDDYPPVVLPCEVSPTSPACLAQYCAQDVNDSRCNCAHPQITHILVCRHNNCLTQPTENCCLEFHEDEACIVRECDSRGAADTCDCDLHPTTKRCKRQACEASPTETCCPAHEDLDACRATLCDVSLSYAWCKCEDFPDSPLCKLQCLSTPNETCCQHYGAEPECVVDRCERSFDEATCSCQDYPNLSQCMKKTACQANPTISCCEEFDQLTDCVTLKNCSEEFNESECPCSKFPDLDECKRRDCGSAPNETCCAEYFDLSECEAHCKSQPTEVCCVHENNASSDSCTRLRCETNFDENTCPCEDFEDLPECIKKAECLADPSVACCEDYLEETACVSFKGCIAEFDEDRCPCDKYSQLDECQRRTCRGAPNETCCVDYFDLSECEAHCKSQPTEVCCVHENNASSKGCTRLRCDEAFDEATCTCDDLTDPTLCIEKAKCLADPSVACCEDYLEETACVSFKSCIAKFDEDRCPCDKYSQLDECKLRTCIAQPNDECCGQFFEESVCVVHNCNKEFVEEECSCEDHPTIKACQASASSSLLVALSGVCVAATLANYVM